MVTVSDTCWPVTRHCHWLANNTVVWVMRGQKAESCQWFSLPELLVKRQKRSLLCLVFWVVMHVQIFPVRTNCWIPLGIKYLLLHGSKPQWFYYSAPVEFEFCIFRMWGKTKNNFSGLFWNKVICNTRLDTVYMWCWPGAAGSRLVSRRLQVWIQQSPCVNFFHNVLAKPY